MKRRDCARQRSRPTRRSSSGRIRGMTDCCCGDGNAWNQLCPRRGRPHANHLVAMSLTLLLASFAAAVAVATGTPLRAGEGDAPAVLAPATHGEYEAETAAVQGGSQGAADGTLLGMERIRRVLVGWGEDGVRSVMEEAGEEQENMG